MILVQDYGMAICFFIIAMICWGSWANTQKLAEKNWRFELFYWDMVIGIVLTATLAALTLGSMGSIGRSFLADIQQADGASISYAMIGGVLWNLGNLLLVAAIAVAGMSAAFPIGAGIAWVLGIIINYALIMRDPVKSFEGNSTLLFMGVAVIMVAIYLSMRAFQRLTEKTETTSTKGITLSVLAGICLAFFYGFVVKSIDNEFIAGGTGNLTPFTSVFSFSIGIVLSTFVFNTYFMKNPVQGDAVTFSQYLQGSAINHLTGMLGGLIWMLGMVASFMAAGAATPAISYALSNAAPVVAILWGVFVWKEFASAPKGTNKLLVIMFVCYIIGLVMITVSNM